MALKKQLLSYLKTIQNILMTLLDGSQVSDHCPLGYLFQTVLEKIAELDNNSIVWWGDFKLVLNPKLDYKNYKTINNINAREKLLEIMNERHLIDSYRDAHPELKR